MKPLALLSFGALTIVVIALFACENRPESTEPSAATAAITYRMTVSGLGTGNGKVTSSPAGINCTITAGSAATTGSMPTRRAALGLGGVSGFLYAIGGRNTTSVLATNERLAP